MDMKKSGATIEQLLSHGDWVRRLTRILVAEPSDADDLEQQVWATAIERPPRSSGNLRGWLGSVVRSLARRRHRAAVRRARHEALADAPAPSLTPDLAIERAQLQRRVVDAVLKLDEIYSAAIVLRFFEDLEPAAMARVLGVPVETARTRVRRGIERLRVALADEFRGDGADWRSALAPLAAELSESGPGATVTATTTAGAIEFAQLIGSKLGVTGFLGATLLVAIAGFLVLSQETEAPSSDPLTLAAPERRTENDDSQPLAANPVVARQQDEAAGSIDDEAAAAAFGKVTIRGSTVRADDGVLTSITADHPAVPHATVLLVPRSQRDWGPLRLLVPQLRALANGTDTSVAGLRRVESDDEGHFEFSDVDQGARWSITAVHPDAGVAIPCDVNFDDPGFASGITVGVGATIEIVGSVTGDDGGVLTDAQVKLEYWTATEVMVVEEIPLSADDRFQVGRFQLELPPLMVGAFCASAPGRVEAEVDVEGRPANGRQVVELRLRSPRALHGTFVTRDGSPFDLRESLLPLLTPAEAVIDQKGGVAVAKIRDIDLDVRRSAVPPASVLSVGHINLEDGTWEIKQTKTSIVLVARHTVIGWLVCETSDRESNKAVDPPRIMVDLGLLPSTTGTGSIHLRMSGEIDSPSQSLPHPLVDLADEFGFPFPGEITYRSPDPAGAVEWQQIPFGTWTVRCWAEGWIPAIAKVTLDSAHSHSNVALQLQRPDAKLVCDVVRSDGSAVKNPDVRLYSRNNSELRAAMYVDATVPEGNAFSWSAFSCLLRQGRYIAVADGGWNSAPSWREIDVTAGETLTTLTLGEPTEVTVRGVTQLPTAFLPLGLGIRVDDESGVPVIDTTHPNSTEFLGHDEVGDSFFEQTLYLARGNYSISLLVSEHEKLTAPLIVSKRAAFEFPLRLRRRD